MIMPARSGNLVRNAVSDVLDSVRTLAVEYLRNSRASELDDPSRAKRHLQTAFNLEAIVKEVETSRKRLRPLSSEHGDISDLPEEVIEQLNLSKLDEMDTQLRDIVASGNGGEVGINQIIIELWRRYKVAKPRTYLMNKLYRMSKKGTIISIEGRNGTYTIPKLSFDQVQHDLKTDNDEGDIPF